MRRSNVQGKGSGVPTLREDGIFTYLWKHKYMYLMLIPAIVYYIVFCYVPMAGTVMAFKKFNPMLGIWGSPWAGLKYFKQLFGLNKFYKVFWNTISISVIRLIFGFPFPIIVALMLNELRLSRLKRAVQTAIYIPQFISWVVLGGILTNLLSTDNGIVNGVIRSLGGQPVEFLTNDRWFLFTLVVSMIWKTFGWNTIIYLAALSGVDPQLYEAAIMDGANRWQQLIHVTLPAIRSTIIVVLILRIGSLMQAGFEQIFVLYHTGVYDVADIIDTYVYRLGLQDGKFELATAVGLFKSVINFALVVAANRVARLFGEEGIY
ncbi:MAG: sugar ABC transporter permease [Clostridia bacterium]|nr:sugar ABC transporter permease [Clostridia bacterium]